MNQASRRFECQGTRYRGIDCSGYYPVDWLLDLGYLSGGQVPTTQDQKGQMAERYYRCPSDSCLFVKNTDTTGDHLNTSYQVLIADTGSKANGFIPEDRYDSGRSRCIVGRDNPGAVIAGDVMVPKGMMNSYQDAHKDKFNVLYLGGHVLTKQRKPGTMPGDTWYNLAYFFDEVGGIQN